MLYLLEGTILIVSHLFDFHFHTKTTLIAPRERDAQLHFEQQSITHVHTHTTQWTHHCRYQHLRRFTLSIVKALNTTTVVLVKMSKNPMLTLNWHNIMLRPVFSREHARISDLKPTFSESLFSKLFSVNVLHSAVKMLLMFPRLATTLRGHLRIFKRSRIHHIVAQPPVNW